MKREYRIRKEDDLYLPEWRSLWTLWQWRKFYYSKDNELEDFVHLRIYKTEEEAWEFIKEKKSQPKFTQYDTINEGEDL